MSVREKRSLLERHRVLLFILLVLEDLQLDTHPTNKYTKSYLQVCFLKM